MINEFLNSIKLKYSLLETEISFQDNLVLIKKWNWDYKLAHEFQLECVDFVLLNPSYIIFILCSHPNVLTMGRGLQKLNSDVGVELKEFDSSLSSILNSPVEYIKRGGGLTFHYPGQLVFYPILNTVNHKLKVYDFMISILDALKLTLENKLELDGVVVRKDLLGLWNRDQNKLASIGLAANRFVTYHGLALNFFEFNTIKKDLLLCHPCGLSGNSYKTIEDLKNVTREDFECVYTSLVKKVYEIIERQRSSFPMIEATSELVNDLNLVEIVLNTESSLS